MPEEVPIVAVDVLLLNHVPPDGLPVNVVVDPTQTELLPEIVEASFTVTVWYA